MDPSEIILLDGGMGTMLQAAGLPIGQLPELWNVTRPEAVTAIHRRYVEAGSRVLYTNTFGANRCKAAGCGRSVKELVEGGVRCARAAAEGRDVKVALDIGPTGRLLEPLGDLGFEEACAVFREIVAAGAEAGADLIVIETMSDLNEMRAAVLAAKENSSLPVWATMTFEATGRSFLGVTVGAMALTLTGLGVDALGFNCSLGPKELLGLVRELREWTALPLILKPNAGLPDPATGEYHITPEEFAAELSQAPALGVSILGGCCGTTPEFIRAAAAALRDLRPAPRPKKTRCGVCSATTVAETNAVRVIGERINPTGKKRFQQALREGDIDYIVLRGVEQQDAGADILDVNVGLPGLDEPEMMRRTVRALQAAVDLPLQIDSSDPRAIEAGLRACCGKAVVNSVNGKAEVLETVLPLCKKYGAAVVGLCMDENGIPQDWRGRVAIARRILDAALAHGYAGLDLPIVNPNQSAMMDAVAAFRVLSGQDRDSEDYIRRFAAAPAEAAPVQNGGEISLGEAIMRGLPREAAALTAKALEEMDELEAVEKLLIPALDRVGERYERGEIFLPQLMKAASAACAGFDLIKTRIAKRGGSAVSKGKIVLATVRGDIHDIGKNIVRVVLENYGYTVVDLGRDVPPQTVVEAAIREDAKLVGLSALMTTTVKSMAETIEALRESGHDCRIMVGGAVLTEEYAAQIGADYYAKDAKQSADIARKVLG